MKIYDLATAKRIVNIVAKFAQLYEAEYGKFGHELITPTLLQQVHSLALHHLDMMYKAGHIKFRHDYQTIVSLLNPRITDQCVELFDPISVGLCTDWAIMT